MAGVTFSVVDWAAWAPGLDYREAWREWAAGQRALAAEPARPEASFLPAMLRRRTSRVTRAALWAVHACGGFDHGWPSVFSSRHGELHRSHALLESLAAGEPLSPNAFSLSVHNTAAGLYSIASANRAPSTAVAAGLDTLPAGLIEAAGRLRMGAERVLWVHADESVPAFYAPWVRYEPSAFGLALVLGPPTAEASWSLAPAPAERGAPGEAGPALELALMTMLAGDWRSRTLPGERGAWAWARD
jgi:hypothetical protein